MDHEFGLVLGIVFRVETCPERTAGFDGDSCHTVAALLGCDKAGDIDLDVAIAVNGGRVDLRTNIGERIVVLAPAIVVYLVSGDGDGIGCVGTIEAQSGMRDVGGERGEVELQVRDFTYFLG